MHEAVRAYVRAHLPDTYSDVIEVGSLDINGGVRDLIDPAAKYAGVDIQPGPGVDVVADFTTYHHPRRVDLILCLEVLEHTANWRGIIASAARNLEHGGTLILTCATNGRAPHSARSEATIGPNEFYQNIDRKELDEEISEHFDSWSSEMEGADLRAKAVAGVTWSVVVPSRSDEKVEQLVENLLDAHPSIRPDQIVIVSDGLGRRTRRRLRDVTIVKGKRPFVYSRAVNAGVSAVDPETDLVIMGDDVRFTQRWAINRLSAISSGDSVVAPEVHGVCGQQNQHPRTRENRADWLTFNCIYIPRRVWDDVGPLDERFVGYGYDDMDWCFRGGGKWPMLIDHDAKVIHMDGNSSFRSHDGWMRLYEENKAIFLEKWPHLGDS